MIDENRLGHRSLPILAGALSSVFYGSVALMPIFLVPIQYTGARRGFKAMVGSAAVSSIVIAAWQTIALARADILSAGTVAVGVSTPLALAIALVAMAWPRLARFSFTIRALVAAAVASALSLPALFAAIRDPAVRAMFLDAFETASSALGAEVLDAEALWSALRTGVASSYGAVLFAFLFLSSWSGSSLGRAMDARTGGRDDAPESLTIQVPNLVAYRVPRGLVWALLAAWTALLVNRFVSVPVFSAVALNAALALSICYGVQGLAVVRALAERVGLAPALRLIGPLAIILLLVSGVGGFVAIGLLALLGTLETWIPFRAVTEGESP